MSAQLSFTGKGKQIGACKIMADSTTGNTVARFSKTVGKATDRPRKPICKRATDDRPRVPKKTERRRFCQKPPMVAGGGAGGGTCPGAGQQFPGGGTFGLGAQQRLCEPQPATETARAIDATTTNKRERFMVTTSLGLPAG
jgi:hypothetical protein